MTTDPRPEDHTGSAHRSGAGPSASRRGLLLGAGVLGGGLLGTAVGYAAGHSATAAPSAGTGGAGAGQGAGPSSGSGAMSASGDIGTSGWAEPGGEASRVAVSSPIGTDAVPFHGDRQAGVDTPGQTHAVFLAFDLDEDLDRDGVRRMLRILSQDAARLTQGRATLADTEPELAAAPARLTVTFGFGRGLVDRIDPDAVPEWLGPLPRFEQIDGELSDEYSDGDLLLQICGDDQMSVAHARRMLTKGTRAFATPRWTQIGFREARGSHPTGTTMRNLFGQVDGTANPQTGSPAIERLVWGVDDGLGADLQPWIEHGTTMVIRRIRMELDTWDELDRPAKEDVIGRRLGTGAPLTGEQENDPIDFEATGPAGFPVISDTAHVRRARIGDGPEHGMLRRGYNYDGADGESGLIFVAFQTDLERQFVPVQQSLAESDHLNMWTTPVGSAVFAVPPGCAEGGFVGDVLFS
ncbi:Dyp-type peroxidase [Micrococcus lylae]|uniref:Dyp-type peroxidase n=1 Tax=Micrococcus lylae TaxID=1273 RepID=A0ABY2JZ51_9MICC|nr:Dyp-type peroxidase [Micrococcus lylae]TFH99081.1 Dyp-type peroxidase [Micrococcus lylae]